MDINIKAIHFDITEKLTAFINKQAIVRLTVPQLDEFVADKTADTFEEAIDVALDALEKQLEKAKNKK